MKKKLVDTGEGRGWDYQLFDDKLCQPIPYSKFNVIYGWHDASEEEYVREYEFINAKEAYQFYKTVNVPKFLWGYPKYGYSVLLEYHDYE
jgi:hypothetical protein